MNKSLISILFLLVTLVISACAGTPTPDVEATAQAALKATEASQPTDTPVPPTDTSTPQPTDTPVPPTNTPVPTNTPIPATDTPESTSTPTPVPPTDTPTPEPEPDPPTATPTPAGPTAEEYFVKGLDYFDQEKWSEAIIEFQEAIRIDPEFSRAYAALGYSYAYGPEDFGKAAEMLEKFLQLNPDLEDRAEIEADIEQLRSFASQPNSSSGYDVPEGKALFVFENNTGEVWVVDVGPHILEVPPNIPPQEITIATVILDPGTYTWQAHSMSANYYITDANGNKAFEFTLAPDEVYTTGCCK